MADIIAVEGIVPPSDVPPLTVGWNEWVSLPDLGNDLLIAKVDTGARTSALHAAEIDRDYEGGAPVVKLRVHTDSRDPASYVVCEAPVVDSRLIRSSTGHAQRRLIVASSLAIGDRVWPVELSITDRKTMRFRMLLGRAAMKGRLLVDPGERFLLGGSLKRPPASLVQATESLS